MWKKISNQHTHVVKLEEPYNKTKQGCLESKNCTTMKEKGS